MPAFSVISSQQHAQKSGPSVFNKSREGFFFKPGIQAKLSINQPDDIYEQEADAMADKVMRMTDKNVVQAKFFKPAITIIQRKCSDCEEEEKKMQRKEMNEDETDADSGLEKYVDNLDNHGQSLPDEQRRFYERRLGHDFSDVKVHTDALAAKSAASINALAYTSGTNIVFNFGQYSPGTDSGKRLLGHELTHVVQQRSNSLPVQRTSMAAEIRGPLGAVSPVAGVGDFPEVFRLLNGYNIADMLDTLWELQFDTFTIYGNIGSATHYDVDRLKAALMAVMFCVDATQVNAADAIELRRTINAQPRDQQLLINSFINSHRRTVPGTTDILGTAHFLTDAQQAQVEADLNPGATVTTTTTSTGGTTTTVTLPPPNPGCGNGAFRTAMRTVIIPYIQSRGSGHRARISLPATFPLAQAGTVAAIAQREVENYFRPYISTVAPNPTYTLGTYSLASMIRDQSQTHQWETQGGRRGWVGYWMNNEGRAVKESYDCDETIVNNIRDEIADDAALRTDIDDTVHGWPAESTGGVHVNPYLASNNRRETGWDVFTTLIHEFIHVIRHPNFRNAGDQINSASTEILKEGLADVFRHELWDGPGNLQNRIAQPAFNSDRTVIEGNTYPFDASKVQVHTYSGQTSDAQTIVTHAGGLANAKAAYFLGHTEFLGLGAGTHVRPGGNLANIGMYRASDDDTVDQVTVLPGENYRELLARTNGSSVLNVAGTVINPTDPLPAVVRIPGVRHVAVIPTDNISIIARQNGVTVFDILRANNLPNGSITVSERLIIPVH